MFRAEATAGVVNTQAEAMHPIDCRRVMAESAAILLRPKLSVDATIAAYMVQGEHVGRERSEREAPENATETRELDFVSFTVNVKKTNF